MAVVNNYIGWATNVNKIILDSTSISLGEGALNSDDTKNGKKRTTLKSGFIPDKYSVVMEFDCFTKDINGKTEFHRFLEWYKYAHKYGSVPFEFPHILYSPEDGVTDVNSGNSTVEYYKITSAVECGKRGLCVQVKMTWETEYFGVVEIEPSLSTVQSVNAYPLFVDVTFSSLGNTEPTSADFELGGATKKGFCFSSYTARIYYDQKSVGSSISVTYGGTKRSTTVQGG